MMFNGAKIRISEHNTKQKSVFLFCIVEREYLRGILKYTKYIPILYEKDGKDVRKGICKANKYVGTKEKGTGKRGESRQ